MGAQGDWLEQLSHIQSLKECAVYAWYGSALLQFLEQDMDVASEEKPIMRAQC